LQENLCLPSFDSIHFFMTRGKAAKPLRFVFFLHLHQGKGPRAASSRVTAPEISSANIIFPTWIPQGDLS
jgi:hypothetical protein